MSEQKLEKLLIVLDNQAQSKELRPQLYHTKIIDDIVEAATGINDITLQLKTLQALVDIVKNEAELQMVIKTSAMYYVVVLLQQTQNKEVQSKCLELLAWYSQTEQSINILLSQHNIQKILVSLADQQIKLLDSPLLTEDANVTCQIGAIMYVMSTTSKKAQNLFQKLGVTHYFNLILRNSCKNETKEQDKLINISLAMLERLCLNEAQTDYFIQQKGDAALVSLLEQSCQADNHVSNENKVCLFNLLATLCIIRPQEAIVLMDMHILKYLLDMILNEKNSEVRRFAISAFVETLYANKGNKYQNIVGMLRSTQELAIDDTITKLLNSVKNVVKEEVVDSEFVSVWGTLMRIISSVPKKEDYIREILLQNRVLSVQMDILADERINLQAKCQVLDAMDQILCVQNVPKQILMEEIPKLVTIMLRLKREFASPRHKTKPDYQVYQDATEKSRSVLEKLGHSEGRDNKKFTAFAMMIVGVGIIIGSAINWIRK